MRGSKGGGPRGRDDEADWRGGGGGGGGGSSRMEGGNGKGGSHAGHYGGGGKGDDYTNGGYGRNDQGGRGGDQWTNGSGKGGNDHHATGRSNGGAGSGGVVYFTGSKPQPAPPRPSNDGWAPSISGYNGSNQNAYPAWAGADRPPMPPRQSDPSEFPALGTKPEPYRPPHLRSGQETFSSPPYAPPSQSARPPPEQQQRSAKPSSHDNWSGGADSHSRPTQQWNGSDSHSRNNGNQGGWPGQGNSTPAWNESSKGANHRSSSWQDESASRSWQEGSSGKGGGRNGGERSAPQKGGYRAADQAEAWPDERNGKSAGKKGGKKGGRVDTDEDEHHRDNGGRKGSGKGSQGSQGKASRGGNGREDNREASDKKGSKKGGKKGSHDNGSDSDSRGDVRAKGGKGKGKAQNKGRKDNNSDSEGDSDSDSEGEGQESRGGKGRGKGRGKGNDSSEAPKEQKEMKKSGGSGAVAGTYLSTRKFSELDVSKHTRKALAEGFGYEMMTQVQAQTIDQMLAGTDVVARAKTGTGKTLAFLVPIIEVIKEGSGVGGYINALILSPTRELAHQIADEAKILLSYHKGLGVQCFVGGTNIKGDHGALRNQAVDILVATPGRIQDHLDNSNGFKERLSRMLFLCMDEADQLLDMGFRDAILKILKDLPAPKKRQGALFSATFPPAVEQISKLALRPDAQFINTVLASDEVTPDQIAQSVAITDLEGMTELFWKCLHSEMKRNPKTYKIMVFFTTARLTQMWSELMRDANMEVLEIHSRKSQPHRTKAADKFRASTKAVMFSSDVTARGMDFPDVTTVIQMGIPSSKDQYIHRLGRTGRAGKSGQCVLLLHDFEQFFLKNVKDLPVKKLDDRSCFPGAPQAPDSLWQVSDPKTGGQAYAAWLGYYNSVKGLGWAKDHLVAEATRFAATIGAVDNYGLPPPILRKTVGMMGLKGVPGLNIVSHLPYGDK